MKTITVLAKDLKEGMETYCGGFISDVEVYTDGSVGVDIMTLDQDCGEVDHDHFVLEGNEEFLIQA